MGVHLFIGRNELIGRSGIEAGIRGGRDPENRSQKKQSALQNEKPTVDRPLRVFGYGNRHADGKPANRTRSRNPLWETEVWYACGICFVHRNAKCSHAYRCDIIGSEKCVAPLARAVEPKLASKMETHDE